MRNRFRWLLSKTALLSAILTLTFAGTLLAEVPPPTFENFKYGPHERNVLDLWQAKSDRPTPLLIFIHGGGFINGDKGQMRNSNVVNTCLQSGVSFASINYRFRNTAPIQEILRDAARAIQTIRSRAKEWNIDPERIASFGGSAGAGTSLWLAFHDDLADPNATDPVLRESSRLAAAGSLNGQASYDLRDWDQIVGPGGAFQRSEADRLSFYGFKSESEAETPAGDKTMKDCSMINLITRDDPPVIVACLQPGGESKDRGHYVHHPKHSLAIADKCKANGIECAVVLLDESKPASPAKTRSDQQAEVVKFLIAKLKGE